MSVIDSLERYHRFFGDELTHAGLCECRHSVLDERRRVLHTELDDEAVAQRLLYAAGLRARDVEER